MSTSHSGIALSEKFFFEVGLPIIKEHFPGLTNRVAAGLVAGGYRAGCGSEIFGFDDELSRDHNWGPRFFVFITEEDRRAVGNDLQACFNRYLPSEYDGFKITNIGLPDDRAYVVTPVENLKSVIKLDAPPRSDIEWINIPERTLFEYTSGSIFYEPTPLITPLKEQFAYYPDNVWYKRLSYVFFLLNSSGTCTRMIRRGDVIATRIYLTWLLESVMKACLLLRRQYAPYRKWLGRVFTSLPDLPDGLVEQIEALSTGFTLSTLEADIARVLDLLGAMANESGLIEPVQVRIETPYHFTDFNFHGFKEAFYKKIEGPLSQKSPNVGPLDLWAEAHFGIREKVQWIRE